MADTPWNQRSRGVMGARASLERVWLMIGAPPPWLVLFTIAGCAISGVLVVSPVRNAMFVLAVLIAAFILGVSSWRRSIRALLVYLPISGIPIVFNLPSREAAVLAKDFLWVAPAYVGFVIAVSHDAVMPTVGLGISAAVLGLGLIVLIQLTNPALQNLLVGLIGVKVWLFYVPLLWVGSGYARSYMEARRLLCVLGFAGTFAIAIGLAQAALIYGGRADTLYALYGTAAADVTQNFAQENYVDGGFLARVPGTFSFGAQYYAFCVLMVAAVYPLVRTSRGRYRAAWIAVLAASLSAALLAGSKGAILAVPALLVLLIVLDARVDPRRALGIGVVFLGASVGTVTLLGVSAADLLTRAATLSSDYLQSFLTSLAQAWAATPVGLGPGMDSTAARYAFSDASQFHAGLAGDWLEQYTSKALVELGIVGFIVVVSLITTILVAGIRAYRATTGETRILAGSLLALLAWQVGYMLKGSYLDLDPVNVCFWLLCGVLLSLPRLPLPPRVEIRR